MDSLSSSSGQQVSIVEDTSYVAWGPQQSQNRRFELSELPPPLVSTTTSSVASQQSLLQLDEAVMVQTQLQQGQEIQRLQQLLGLVSPQLPGTGTVLFQQPPWLSLNAVPLGSLVGANIADLQARQMLLEQQYLLLSAAAPIPPTSYSVNPVVPALSSQAPIRQRALQPHGTNSLLVDQASTQSCASNYHAQSNSSEEATSPPSEPALKRPKRALTSYNLFFKSRREQLIAEQGQQQGEAVADLVVDPKEAPQERQSRRNSIRFEEMAKIIGKEWKEIDPQTLARYEAEARKDKERYRRELAIYNASRNAEQEAKRAAMELSVPDEVRQRYFAEASRKNKRKKR